MAAIQPSLWGPWDGYLCLGSGLGLTPLAFGPGPGSQEELQARKRRQHKSKHVTNSCYASKIPGKPQTNACRSLTSWCNCCQPFPQEENENGIENGNGKGNGDGDGNENIYGNGNG